MRNKYKSYKSDTNSKEAAILVEKIIHKKVVDIERVDHGEVNAVYFIRSEEGKEYVLRISPNERDFNNFEVEAWAFGQCRKFQVPTPRVIAIDTSKKFFPEVYMLTERMPGKSGNLVRLNYKDKVKVVEELGFYMSKIHKVKIRGFGRLVKNGDGFVGFNKSMYEAIDNDFIDGWWVKIVLKNKLFPEAEMDRIRKFVRRNKNIFNLYQGVLVHGDLSAYFKNINLSGTKITGIFDMESARSYDPVFDIAWFDFWRGGSYYLKFLVDGYIDKSIFDDNFEKKNKIYQLLLAYSLIAYYHNRNNKDGLDYSMKKLNILKNKLRLK